MNWIERFWSKVDIRGEDECWPWLAFIHPRGYGQFQRHKNQPVRAHRIAWQVTYGPIPFGKLVCHKCDVRHCCNPKHLWIGTAADNTADMVKKGRAPKGPKSCFSPARKLTVEQVREIRQRRQEGEMNINLAAEFGLHPDTICSIVRKKTWVEA